MKLTGWYRIGIVLSVLWCLFVIGVTIYHYNNPDKYSHSILVSLEPDPTHTLYDPFIGKTVILDKTVINYGNIFIYMIVPIVSGWILVFTIVWTIKWIVRGFKSHSSKS